MDDLIRQRIDGKRTFVNYSEEYEEYSFKMNYIEEHPYDFYSCDIRTRECKKINGFLWETSLGRKLQTHCS